ncbi:hypothetical protein ACFWMS_23720 [Peribacillus butanolivorans]|uniref:hypothetical protein n=1 Tax=Peribacillus butanolivorans TaxID=421767 RepID=UPI003669601E
MTVLIGFVENKKALILGDTKTTHMKHGENQGTFEEVYKVHAISENVLIGIGGDNDLGIGITKMLSSVFKLNHSQSLEEILDYIQKTCVFAYDMFKQVHPTREPNLSLIVAGVDKDKNDLFLYEVPSNKNFIPQKPNIAENLIVRGASQQNENEVTKFIIESIRKGVRYESFQQLFSAAVRSSDHEMVSKDTYSVALEYDEIKGFSALIFTVDEKGNLKQHDKLLI